MDFAAERLWRELGAGEGSNRLGRCVRLLGGETAMFDCEVGGVTGSVDTVDASHLGVFVDRDKPVFTRR